VYAPGQQEGAKEDVRVRAIDALLAKNFKPDEPGVNVIVVEHGVILLRKAYGLADMTSHVAMQPEFSLRVGSLTKQFTAAAIMLLAERGQLTLSDEIGKYLPQLPEPMGRVSIENLLTHTSGIKNYTSLPQFFSVMSQQLTVAEALEFFTGTPLDFLPGKRFSYSNSNYFLLGAIIEQVSGVNYADFMQKEVFGLLEMHDSVIENPSEEFVVKGYSSERKNIVRVADYAMSWPFSAGAMRTSVDDLAKWDQAITRGALLTRSSWERMAKDATLSNGSHTGYGFGWFVRKVNGKNLLEHGGDIGGFSADMWRLPDQEIFIAVLTNNDNHQPAADEIAAKIAKIVLSN